MRAVSHRIVDLITTTTDKRFEPVACMADEIINLTLQQGDCLPQDLRAKGFSHHEITAFWHFANALAAVELKHIEGRLFSLSQREVRYA